MAGATFLKGGVHPEEHKELTEHLAIEVMPLPDQVALPLSMHFGAPAKPIVERKQKVEEGEPIAIIPERALGAVIHSSVTGVVKGIEPRSHPTMVKCDAIIIDRDPDAPPREYPAEDWRSFSREQLLATIKDAGIVGLGGAGFPTHVKLSPPPSAKVDTLVLNGAECEPYLTTDHRLMLEYPEQVVVGAKILLKTLGIKHCIIGVELNKPDAINALTKAAKAADVDELKVSVQGMVVKYPQGSEKQLIYSLTQRSVPGGGLPFDVGVIVQNISTTVAVFEAATMGKPLYEKVMTVSGRAISRPANVKVRVGTRLADVVDYLGGTTRDLLKIVSGGPMMGFAISSLDVPVTKTTSGVLFLGSSETDLKPSGPCIHCGWCVKACPMGLMPKEVAIYVEAGKGHLTEKFGVFECFECGCCAYVCPAKRPLVQFARLAKLQIKQAGK
ncbi:MAG: electron transport complex subunit RsxC [Thermodesulfobacteriota bacterium]